VSAAVPEGIFAVIKPASFARSPKLNRTLQPLWPSLHLKWQYDFPTVVAPPLQDAPAG
jgi:hypothetical protein